jgi:Rrf2 family nitric oxide-sensitive transcriptional repressor
MKITRASDYAIRLLAHLAAGEVETTGGELANELGIPFNHLSKLIQKLARRGFLSTRKGKGGGLRLAVNPKNINLAQVIEVVEGPLVLSECILNRSSCQFSGKCKARKCLAGIKQRMNQMLVDTTIFDLALQY